MARVCDRENSGDWDRRRGSGQSCGEPRGSDPTSAPPPLYTAQSFPDVLLLIRQERVGELAGSPVFERPDELADLRAAAGVADAEPLPVRSAERARTRGPG